MIGRYLLNFERAFAKPPTFFAENYVFKGPELKNLVYKIKSRNTKETPNLLKKPKLYEKRWK